jgi:hypothetical protein
MSDIKNFTIFGERNSGTAYLKKVLEILLDLKFTQDYGLKHFYIKDLEPRGLGNTTTDNNCIKSIYDSDDTLFIVIVRNAYDWVGAMHKTPYYMKQYDKSSIYNFITTKYIGAADQHPREQTNAHSKILWSENKNHKYPYFIDEDTNLIELRNLKNNHFDNLKNNVKHYYLIRQEKLMEDINNMIVHHNLKRNSEDLPPYKKPAAYLLDSRTINFIKNNLNNNIDSECYSVKPVSLTSSSEAPSDVVPPPMTRAARRRRRKKRNKNPTKPPDWGSGILDSS